MHQYSLLEIYSIKNNLVDYNLEQSICSKIDELFNILNITNQRNKVLRKEKNVMHENGKWIKKEPFKATKLEKKEGLEEELDNLRSFLNKLVENNYDEQKDKILECVQKIVNMDDDDKHDRLMDRFYMSIINNQRYSRSYSKIYLNMIDIFLVLEDYQSMFIDRYNNILNDLEYIDPDKDYDGYCRVNKINLQRKCLLCFIISCVENEIYSFNELLQIINNLFDILNKNIKNNELLNINEEIVENIFTALQQGKELILNEVCKYDIMERIKYYSSLSIKDNSGFSSRMKFKMMDIIDLYK